MRHGNRRKLSLWYHQKGIPILPMRHGNICNKFSFLAKGTNSDPTYEAWKLVFEGYASTGDVDHSDPTYEAWKHSPNR